MGVKKVGMGQGGTSSNFHYLGCPHEKKLDPIRSKVLLK